MSLWSPMTHSRPGGTTILNLISEGASPGYRYVCSVSGTPLTVTRPCASQQATVSPGKPMTRLMRMCPGRRTRVPRAVPVEDHDVAAVDAADVVDELVDQHPVVDLERVLHRPGRYEEGLDRVGLDDDREQQGDDDQDRELAPERPLPAPAAGGWLAAAGGGLAVWCRIRGAVAVRGWPAGL